MSTPVPGPDPVLDLLGCPVCAGRDPAVDAGLERAGRALRCPAGHTFDVARQGYVNLLGRAAPGHADTAAMVAARERFLGSGAYDPVADGVLDAVRRHAPHPVGAVLEAGAGPGWYLARLLRGLGGDDPEGTGRPCGLALDVSAAAARRAAATLAGLAAGSVVADVWGRLPVRDGVLDVVLSVFAPRHAAEFARVLRPGGTVVVVAPLPAHLAPLREVLGLLQVEPGKQQRLDAALGEHLEPVAAQDVVFARRLDAGQVGDLVAMGPNAFHLAPDALAARVAGSPLPPEVPVAVRVGVWRRP